MNVKLEWLWNSFINHTDAKINYIESDGSPQSKKFICEKYDEYYNKHKEELKNRIIYFMSIHKDCIEIYVRPEGWEKNVRTRNKNKI